MTKGITIRVSEELKTKFNVYCAKNQVTATKVLTDHIENLINEGENKMKKYRVETVEYEKDLQTFKDSWTELETYDKEEAYKEYRSTINNSYGDGGVILSEIDEEGGGFDGIEEHNFERIKVIDEAFKEWFPENRAISYEVKPFADYVKRTRPWLADEVEYAELYDAHNNYFEKLNEEKEWHGTNFTVIMPDKNIEGLYEFKIYQDDKLVGTASTHEFEEAQEMVDALDRGESPEGWGDGVEGYITLK